jgi:GntR family transcriptional repressor for pyruvate dehydrogenase complex
VEHLEFKAIVAPTIKELFIDRMIGLILSGKLEVGERLPPERELAAEMKVSKTIVHSGLTELDRMGFVSIVPRKGTFVANYAELGTQETLNALLKYNGGKLDMHTVRSMFEFRSALEGTAFKKFSENHSDKDIEALQQIVDRVKKMSADEDSFTTEDLAEEIFSFHHAVCVRSGNNVFPLVLNAFRTVSIVFWINGIRMYGREVSAAHTEKYFEYLKNRDAAGALEYLHEDFDYYLANVK